MSELKCPFCGEELSYAQEIDGGFEMLTCDCPHGIWLFGNDKMWYNLEKAITDLERTRKALDVAVDILKLVCQGNGDPQDIMRYKDNRWTSVRRLCKQALEQITALEQKEE